MSSIEHRLIGFDRDDRAFRSRRSLCVQAHARDIWLSLRQRPGPTRGACGPASASAVVRRISRQHSPDLIRLFAGEISIPLEIWLVMHEDLKSTPRMRALFERLAAGLADYVEGRTVMLDPARI